MNSLPSTNQDDYWVQSTYNGSLVEKLFEQLFPGIPQLIEPECLFEIIAFLSETKVNPRIIPKVIRGINNILMGTGSGQVIVHVSKESMNVSVRENDEEIKCKVKS